MDDKLKACPFCGKDVAIVTSCVGIEGCENFEECNHDGYSCVVCNAQNGGCGASGGYYPSDDKAIEAWNRRTPNE